MVGQKFKDHVAMVIEPVHQDVSEKRVTLLEARRETSNPKIEEIVHQIPKDEREIEALVAGPLRNLLTLAGINSKKPEDIFNIDALRRESGVIEKERDTYRDLPHLLRPEGRKTLEFLELLTRLYLDLDSGIYGPNDLRPERRLSDKEKKQLEDSGIKAFQIMSYVELLGAYIKDEVAKSLSDTIGKILLEYVNTTGRIYIYRGVSFNTEEEREAFVSEIKKSGITKESYSSYEHYKGICVSAFKSNAEEWGRWGISSGNYIVLLTIDFSKVAADAYPIKYSGSNEKALRAMETEGIGYQNLFIRGNGEFRIRGSVPPEAIVKIELEDKY